MGGLSFPQVGPVQMARPVEPWWCTRGLDELACRFKRLPLSKVVGDLFVTFSRRKFLAYRLPGEKENLVPWDAAEVGPTASACREIPHP